MKKKNQIYKININLQVQKKKSNYYPFQNKIVQ